MEELKKSRRIFLTVIAIFILVSFLGMTTYIRYERERILSKASHVQEEVPDEEEIIEEKVKELSNNFAKYFPITDISRIDNQDLLFYALSKIDSKETIKKEEIEQAVANTFGNNLKGKHENINCPTNDQEPLYYYQNKVYKQNHNHGRHGEIKKPKAYPYKIDITKKNNILTANYKILYSNYCNDTCITNNYYKSYQDSKNNINKVLSSNDDKELVLTEDLYKSIEEDLPTTTFTFKKGKDTYNLVSITIE